MTRVFIAIPSIGINDIRATVALASLKKPTGTAIAASPRGMPDAARNALFDQAMKFGYDYILYIDDDMVVDPGLVVDLKYFMDENPDVVVAGPLAFRRHPPHYPCVSIKSGDKYGPLDDLDGGPCDVDAIHFAATIVRCEALKKIPPPRFEFSHNGDSVTGEDWVLSGKLKDNGGRVVCLRNIPEAEHVGIPPLIGRKAWEATRRRGPGIIVAP